MRIKKTLVALIFLTVVHSGGVPLHTPGVYERSAEAAVLKTLSGRVLEVDTRHHLLRVDFRHPATGERKELLFAVSPRTGLSGMTALHQLRYDDPVTIDYDENSQGVLEARHISKVRLTGPPAGVENFRGF